MSRRTLSLALAAALLPSTLLVGSATAQAAPQPTKACVNTSTGAVRVIPATKTCKKSEVRLRLDATAFVGPVGPTGPAGATFGAEASYSRQFLTESMTTVARIALPDGLGYVATATVSIITTPGAFVECQLVPDVGPRSAVTRVTTATNADLQSLAVTDYGAPGSGGVSLQCLGVASLRAPAAEGVMSVVGIRG